MPDIPAELDVWIKETASLDAGALLAWALKTFGEQAAFATSLGLEDQVLAHLIHQHAPGLPCFMLDTGRLFPETYTLLERTEQRYGLGIQVYFPASGQVEGYVREHGINGFRNSVELRKECCRVRKTEPLKRALAGKRAWVCGLRQGQSQDRAQVAPVAWDASQGLIKICPLASWSESQLWELVKAEKVPYNPLHDQGFPSIGCAPCTRAIKPGEDIRAGRWWWESSEHKECGLHQAR
jgi:phosphoadenosine phosphosulfate reductase